MSGHRTNQARFIQRYIESQITPIQSYYGLYGLQQRTCFKLSLDFLGLLLL